MALRPGEIYFANYEDMEPHRVIIVSREEFNRGKYATVIVCTSQRLRERAQQPNCIFFREGEFGFTKDCVAQAETISFIEIRDLDLSGGPIATVDAETMRTIIKTIGYILQSDCEPE